MDDNNICRYYSLPVYKRFILKTALGSVLLFTGALICMHTPEMYKEAEKPRESIGLTDASREHLRQSLLVGMVGGVGIAGLTEAYRAIRRKAHD